MYEKYLIIYVTHYYVYIFVKNSQAHCPIKNLTQDHKVVNEKNDSIMTSKKVLTIKNLADEDTFFECGDALEIRKAKGRGKVRRN